MPSKHILCRYLVISDFFCEITTLMLSFEWAVRSGSFLPTLASSEIRGDSAEKRHCCFSFQARRRSTINQASSQAGERRGEDKFILKAALRLGSSVKNGKKWRLDKKSRCREAKSCPFLGWSGGAERRRRWWKLAILHAAANDTTKRSVI